MLYSTGYCLTSCFTDIPQVTQHFCAAVQGTSLEGLQKDPHLEGGKEKGTYPFLPFRVTFLIGQDSPHEWLNSLHPTNHSRSHVPQTPVWHFMQVWHWNYDSTRDWCIKEKEKWRWWRNLLGYMSFLSNRDRVLWGDLDRKTYTYVILYRKCISHTLCGKIIR